MQLRTDLAIEANEISGGKAPGTELRHKTDGTLRITEMTITTQQGAQLLKKPMGRYITMEGLSLTECFRDVSTQIQTAARELAQLLPESGSVLVIGLGNRAITPDALGPLCTRHILATRHITGELAKSTGLDRLRPVSVIAPGVLGQTGIEAAEMISGLVRMLSPAAVIAIDALAARSLPRLGCTIQISDTGIAPGSGVGNHRTSLNRESTGVPVIAVGIPTVVDASTLALDILSGIGDLSDGSQTLGSKGDSMMVTPREIDLLIERASKIIGMAVNLALQPEYDFDTLAALTA